MTATDHFVRFACQGDTLVGVLTRPSDEPSSCIVVVVGGPQYRAGSHRLFVAFARGLAANGHAVLRFDRRGMGDSTGDPRPFDEASDDIGCAIDAVRRELPSVRQITLFGLCDGASAALIYLASRNDARVARLCLMNPWVRSDVGQARTNLRHHYIRRLRQKEFWLKLFAGRVAASAPRDLLRSVGLALRRPAQASGTADTASFQDRMVQGWHRFGGPCLLVLSDNDFTAKEFDRYTTAQPKWQAVLNRVSTTRTVLAEADHTVSDPKSKAALIEKVHSWLRDA